MKCKALVSLILISLLISGCSMPSLPIPSMPKLPFNPESIPFLGDLIKKLPFFSSEEPEKKKMKEGGNTSSNTSTINVTQSEKASNATQIQTGESEKPESEVPKVSKLSINPIYAEYNRSIGWSVIFQLNFLTNVKEEDGKWQIFLYSNKLIDKRSLDTINIAPGLKGFSTNYSVRGVKEGDKFRIKMEKEVRLVQPGGSTSASFKLEKEIDANFASNIRVVDTKIQCGRIDYLLNISGLLPAKLTTEIKLGKAFTKTFRITGGESLDVNFDSNLNRNFFKVKNGRAEIHLNLEKFLRIAAIPTSGGEILLKSTKVLSSVKFEKPNVTVKSESGRIILENANGSLPIYIDSIVLVEENSRSLAVGRILCDKIEITSAYHGRILVIGGPNLIWNEYKERYQTEKPEYILFDGEI